MLDEPNTGNEGLGSPNSAAEHHPGEPEKANNEPSAFGGTMERSQAETGDEPEDKSSSGENAADKLIDAFALASHDEFLGFGDDPYRWEPDRDWYEPFPTIDLVRRGGSIRVSRVEWNGPRPRITTYAPPVRYRGETYGVSALPASMYDSMFLPTDVTSNYAAREVFDGVYNLLQNGQILTEEQCELLTPWCIATWFSDVLDFVPRLTVTGSSYAADLLFRLLGYACRRAVLLAGIKPAVLKQIPVNDLLPTLLVREINPGKSAAALLDATDRRGYFVACGRELQQYYCAKCVYIGEDCSPKQKVDGIHIHLERKASWPARPFPSTDVVQRLQNQLFTYRSFNLGRVQYTPLSLGELLPDFDPLAVRLRAVIFEDLELQERVTSVLREQNEQARVDRASGIDAIVLRAVLYHCHERHEQVCVGKIAATANRISADEGESLKLSSEKVGHALKRLGLYSCRLGGGPRGLILDRSKQLRAHQLSLEYGVLPASPQCGYCQSVQVPQSEEVV